MYNIHINHKDIGPTDYTIYRKCEADEEGIDYVYWKDCKESGCYCLTDDNYVAYLIKRKEYDVKHRTKKSIYLRFPFGYIVYTKGSDYKLIADGRLSQYTMTGKKYMNVQAKQEKMKNLATTYARVMDKDVAINLAFPNGVSDTGRGRWRRMMRTEVFRDMVREELQAMLLESGLTEKFTLNLLGEAIDMAKEKRDVTNLLKAVSNLEELHGMLSKEKTKTTNLIEAQEQRNLIDQIGKETRKLKATQVIENE